MEAGTPRHTPAESRDFTSPQRRRSTRGTSLPAVKPVVAVKRSFAVRKIVPRKTAAPSEHDKENAERRSGGKNVSTPGSGGKNVSTPDPRPPSAAKAKRQAAMPSPIQPSSPPPQQPVDPEDLVWSQKARRSYSRLSDKSPHSPDPRKSMFGFERLKTPEIGQKVKQVRDISASISGLSFFSSLLEAEDCGNPEPDLNIPGVVLVKEKRKRKKVQQIKTTELDALAAQMNAEFDEAEGFELVVE